ncbi:MAG TPA: hypothetical protein VMZ00_01810 [Sporichthya sp.]|nr:hypothetical protein [Sporichthya sp.]
MAIREKMRANAAPHLQPGENLQAVFGAQTWNQYALLPLVLFGVLPAILVMAVVKPLRVVLVTDRRIVICQAGSLLATKIHGVVKESPRATALGEPTGLWWKCTTLGNTKMYVHKRFHTDVRKADALRPPEVAEGP